jgi:1,4-alpha-glucan branching enzyme
MSAQSRQAKAMVKSPTLTPSLPSSSSPKTAAQAKSPKTKAGPARSRVARRTVRFGLVVPNAQTVSVVGSFNNWTPGATPLRCLGGAKWFEYLLLAVGRYEYRFVVDGKWVDDPNAKAYVPNPHGGRNALLPVE